jgi:hypothetical protein
MTKRVQSVDSRFGQSSPSGYRVRKVSSSGDVTCVLDVGFMLSDDTSSTSTNEGIRDVQASARSCAEITG